MKKLVTVTLLFATLFNVSFTALSQESNLILKKRLAITPFTDGTEGQVKVNASTGGRYSQGGVTVSNYSSTLVTMLGTELVKSNAFIVVERAQLDAVFKEQDLGASGATTKESAAKMNQILGVQLLITGSITEWGNKVQNDKHDAGGFFLITNQKIHPAYHLICG